MNNPDNPPLPAGITSWDPMPYRYRRWNGTIWANWEIDSYNRQLEAIRRHYNEVGDTQEVQSMIDMLYRLSGTFDRPLLKEEGND